MKPPFNLVVVHGDGSRVLRFCVPRWVAYGALGSGAAVLATMIGLSGDYAFHRRQAGKMAALRELAGDQRAFIEAVEQHVPAIRNEIMGWRTLHAKMWDAFGSNTAGTAGVGGPTAEDVLAESGKLEPVEELRLLASGVAEEGPRLRELARVVRKKGRLLSALPLGWPIRGPVNSEFGTRRSPWSGEREHHYGMDIGGPTGTPIKAPAAGTVIAASSRGSFGRHVTLDHGNGVRSRYGHMSGIAVKAGERVAKGQVIGVVGSTGRSTGPHLHYELIVDGKRVDPRGFLFPR